MRKLFRFKYEPCEGTCYAWCDHLPTELNKLPDERRKAIISMMVDAHNKLCDNPEYSFGVDLDDSTRMFVAHFRTPNKTNTYLKNNFEDCVIAVCSEVLVTNIPQIEGSCNYGDNGAENLGKEILRACLDIVYREEHHKTCPCNVA